MREECVDKRERCVGEDVELNLRDRVSTDVSALVYFQVLQTVNSCLHDTDATIKPSVTLVQRRGYSPHQWETLVVVLT